MSEILYSPGFGAGWFTWNPRRPECLTDPEIIAAVKAGDRAAAQSLAEGKWPDGFWAGARDLEIKTLATGTMYRVVEYDGSESVETYGSGEWMTA